MRRRAASGLLALLVATPAPALDPAKRLTQYVQDVWTTDRGLPQNVVQALAQTPDGYLWLGTQEGLVRFDGVRFTSFDWKSTSALRSNNIIALHADGEGTLWIGSEGGGVATLRGGVLEAVKRPPEIANASGRAFAHDGAGNVWIATSRGLARISRAGASLLGTRDGLTSQAFSALAVSPDGVWAGTHSSGLNRVSDAGNSSLRTSDGLADDSVFALLRTRSGDLWIGSRGGLTRLSAGKLTRFGKPDGLGDDTIQALLEDREGNVWIGTAAGLCRYREGRFACFAATETLGMATVSAMLLDREGSLWLATDGGGLARLRDGKVTPIGEKEGLTGDVVFSAFQSRDGALWLGTRNGGLNRVVGEEVTAFLTKASAGASAGFSLGEAAGGDLWVGMDLAGLYRLSKGRVAGHFTRADGLSSNTIDSILEARDGTLWIGTAGGGVCRYAGGRFERVGKDDGLGDDPVFAILEDRAGALWFATQQSGVVGLSNGRFVRYGAAEGLGTDTALSLTEGQDGSLWIGTYGGGLARLRGGKLTRVSTQQGLYNDVVYQVLEDGHGALWMSCNKGLFSVRIADLDRLESGAAKSLRCAVLGRADGLRTADINGGAQPAGGRLADGRLVFPSMSGAVLVDPARLDRNTVPPPVHVEEVVADGVPHTAPFGAPAAVRIPPGKRNLEVRYTALSLRVPERVRFRYRLEPFQDEWVEAGTRRAAYFTNVPPGAFTFRVLACNDDGVWNDEGASLAIRLEPFFWERRLFLLVWLAAAALVVWAVHGLRMRRVKAEFALILKERGRMAREIHDSLAQGLTGIALQLAAAADVVKEDPEEALGHVSRAQKLAKLSLGEARRSVWALRSEALEAHDLPKAVAEMANQMAAGGALAVEVNTAGDPRGLSPEAEEDLFRIAQEAVANALKYSGASRLEVEVGGDAREAWISVRDDGRGFEPEAARSTSGSGFGLVGMRERMARRSGSLEVNSAPGRGTRITARLPRSL